MRTSQSTPNGVIAHVRDRRGQDPGAQRLGQVLKVCDTDPKDPLKPTGLGAADLMVEVQAVGSELLADPGPLLGARESLPDRDGAGPGQRRYVAREVVAAVTSGGRGWRPGDGWSRLVIGGLVDEGLAEKDRTVRHTASRFRPWACLDAGSRLDAGF